MRNCDICIAEWYYYKFEGAWLTIRQNVPLNMANQILPIHQWERKINGIKSMVNALKNRTDEEKEEILKEVIENEIEKRYENT